MELVLFALFLSSSARFLAAQEWTYDEDLGPEEWPSKYQFCGGRQQSPIDIDVSKAVYDPRLTPLTFKYYIGNRDLTYVLVNVAGHTAEVEVRGRLRPSIIGAGLSSEYQLDQLHFHWGPNCTQGSEHSINGKYYPLEMHLVHHSKLYPTFADAATKPNGVAVVAVLFQVGENNTAIDYLEKNFAAILNADQQVPVFMDTIVSLLPDDIAAYYQYRGSLTTPPCYESVTWIILKEHPSVSEAELAIFRKIRDHSGHDIKHNFRPAQPLNKRKVCASRSA